jgi:hypothetical protein
MSLFLLTFFLIYGSAHLYIFLKIKAAFVLGMAGTIALIARRRYVLISIVFLFI